MFFQYITKPEQKSNSFQDMITKIVQDTNEEELAVRTVLSKVMMKLVKQHDMCKNEAWKVASGEEFVEFSRDFVTINVTQKRRIALEKYHQGDVNSDALTKNHADMYWIRDEEAAYHEACETLLAPATIVICFQQQSGCAFPCSNHLAGCSFPCCYATTNSSQLGASRSQEVNLD